MRPTYWRTSTTTDMKVLLPKIYGLSDAHFAEIVFLDSNTDAGIINEFVKRIGYLPEPPNERLIVSLQLLHRLGRGLTGYDEIWFYPTTVSSDRPIVPLQSVSSDWDLSIESAPLAVVESAQLSGASLIISNCGGRHVIYFGAIPPDIGERWHRDE